MTEKQALNQSLSRPDKMDWLISDFLNLEVVGDEDIEQVPVLVKHLSEKRAKIALGIAINYINQQNTKLKKIRNLL